MSPTLELVSSLAQRTTGAAQQLHAHVLAGNIPNVKPQQPPGGDKVLKVVGWLGWGMFLACVAGVFIIVIKMGVNAHKTRGGDGGGEEAGKLFWPLLGCIIGSGAGALLGAVA